MLPIVPLRPCLFVADVRQRGRNMNDMPANAIAMGDGNIVVQQIGPDDETGSNVATTYSHVDVPLAGIGDTALNAVKGTTLAASKSDMYCRIEVVGNDIPTDDTVTTDRGEALARKLGAPCERLFAS